VKRGRTSWGTRSPGNGVAAFTRPPRTPASGIRDRNRTVHVLAYVHTSRHVPVRVQCRPGGMVAAVSFSMPLRVHPRTRRHHRRSVAMSSEIIRRHVVAIVRRLLLLNSVTLGLFVGGCDHSDTLTGNLTRVATPTPLPSASLSGRVEGSLGVGQAVNVPVSGATVSVQQGTRTSVTTSSDDGSYEIPGLVTGTADVLVSGRLGSERSTSATLVLMPGNNVWNAHL